MKVTKRKNFIFSILVAVVLLTGCGGAEKNYSDMMASGSTSSFTNQYYAENGFAPEASIEEGAATLNDSVSVQDPLANRKLIKTVDMSVETKEFDGFMMSMETKVTELGGYIETLETYNGSIYSGYRSNRNASMTIRIPQEELKFFLEQVGNLGSVIRHSENVQDVTLSYVDLESHKKVLLAEQKRLLELIDEAALLEDILTIESRLTEVRYQLESMEAQLRTYDNKIDYSTILLNVNEVKELTPVEERTVLQRMGDDFMENLQDVGVGFVEFAIWFVGSIPYFVVWIFIIGIIVLVIKVLIKWKKSCKKKKNKSTEKKADDETGHTKEEKNREQP